MQLAHTENTYVGSADNETPPAGKEKEAGCVLNTLGWCVVVLVVVGNEGRSDNGNNESNKGEDDEADRVAPADGSRSVDHCKRCPRWSGVKDWFDEDR